jgi:carboxypeptidase Taq
VASLLGYDFRRGRLDRSVHPFTTGVHPDDVRITVRVHPGNLGFGLFALIHEVGHALYEQGLPRAFARTPLGTAISTSVHESQSRFFENVVGRHPAFWRHLTPLVQSYFPGVADDVSAPAFARAAQTVRPGPIRVEADELSYSLHIVLRFRLEVALLSGELSVAEVPAAWRELSQELLGVLPEDDVLGPLQDIHWALGEFASFPSYALGNLVAAILYEALLAEMGEEAFSAALAAGDLAPVRAFLSRRLWQHGARFGLDEWLREEIGNELSALPYLRYLAGRYAD